MYEELSDEKLIQLVSENDDKKAFNEIYKRYEKPIYNYLNRLVYDKDILDEIFQEVFTKIYVKAETFKAKYSFKAWIYKVSMNQYIDYYKRLKRRNKIFDSNEDMTNVKYDAPETLDKIISEESINKINKLLDELPEKYKQAVILKKIEGMTFEEVANVMGVSSRSVKSYVARGVEMLKRKFEKEKLLVE